MALTLKQSRFIDAYLGEANGNATQAARLAGYQGDDHVLRSVGAENLTKPDIQHAIAERTAEFAAASQGAIATADEVLGLLSATARLEAIKPTCDPKLRDALRAQELLGKYHGLWTDQTVVDVHVGEYAQSLVQTVLSVIDETVPDADQRHKLKDALLTRLSGGPA